MKPRWFAAAAIIGFGALTFSAAPSMAAPFAPGALVQGADTHVVDVRYHRPRKICRWETVRTRGPHGRPIVKRIQRCVVR